MMNNETNEKEKEVYLDLDNLQVEQLGKLEKEVLITLIMSLSKKFSDTEKEEVKFNLEIDKRKITAYFDVMINTAHLLETMNNSNLGTSNTKYELEEETKVKANQVIRNCLNQLKSWTEK